MKSIKIYTAAITLSLLMIIYSACSKSGGTAYGGGSGSSGTNPPANTISIKYNTFSPDSYTVKVGTTIKFQNNDGVSHSATSDDGSSFDLDMAGGTSKSFTFNTVGTFGYHCKYHSGMTAAIIVTL